MDISELSGSNPIIDVNIIKPLRTANRNEPNFEETNPLMD